MFGVVRIRLDQRLEADRRVKKHSGDPKAWDRKRIKVGEATITLGEGSELRIQLPESAGS